MLNAIYDLNIHEFKYYKSTIAEITDRWAELEANGEIAPPYLGLPNGLFLQVNFTSVLTDIISDYEMGQAINTCDVQSLYPVIVNWTTKSKEDQEKKLWDRQALAKLLNISQYDLNGLCEYLQILQPEISTPLLDYYFRAIRCAITDNTSYSNFEGVESIGYLAEGTSLLAYGKERFPGLKYKEEWNIKELAQYLAVNETPLFIELQDIIQDAKVSTEKLLPLIPQLAENLNSERTQRASIRFARYGKDFNEDY